MSQSPAPEPVEDSLVIARVEGADGREFQVRGAGFAPSTEVALVLTGSRDTVEPTEGLPQRIETVTTDDAGRFDATIGVGDAIPSSRYVLEARGENPDGSREVLARDIRIGQQVDDGDSLFDTLRWAGYSFLLLALLVFATFAARRFDEWRSSRNSEEIGS